MSDQREKKNRIIAMFTSLGIHLAVLLAFLFMMAWRAPNPPFPEYTSGHSTQSGSAAKILASMFGETFSFTDRTHTRLGLGLLPRSFSSFYEMAEEAGISRIYGGIHFSSANLQGRASGYAIGDEVLNLQFKKP